MSGRMGTRQVLQALVFDFDGTLAETNIDFGEMRRQIYGLIQRWGVWEEGMGDNRYVLEVIAAAERRMAEEGARARFAAEAAQILIEVEMAACATAAPYTGVPEALARLRKAGLKIGIVTRNCRVCVEDILQRHPLPYDVCLTRDDVTRIKPDPAHLLQALEQLQTPPPAALMIGDHRSDIECARAAGCGAIGIWQTGTTAEQFAALGALASFPNVAAFAEALLAGRLYPHIVIAGEAKSVVG